jgi:hypothetical protein
MNVTVKLTAIILALGATFAAQATTSSISPPVLVSYVPAYDGGPTLSAHNLTSNWSAKVVAELIMPFSSGGHSGTLQSEVYNFSGSTFDIAPWCCNQVGSWIPFSYDRIYYQIMNDSSSMTAINEMSQKLLVGTTVPITPGGSETYPAPGAWNSQYKGAFGDFVAGMTKASSTAVQTSTLSWDGVNLAYPTTTTFGNGIMPGTSSYIGEVWTSPGAYTLGTISLDGQSITAFVQTVPEPEEYALMLAGLGLIGAAIKRRKAKQA